MKNYESSIFFSFLIKTLKNIFNRKDSKIYSISNFFLVTNKNHKSSAVCLKLNFCGDFQTKRFFCTITVLRHCTTLKSFFFVNIYVYATFKVKPSQKIFSLMDTAIKRLRYYSFPHVFSR